MTPAKQPRPGDARFILLTGLCIGAFLSLIPVSFQNPKALLMPLFAFYPDSASLLSFDRPFHSGETDPMVWKWVGLAGLGFSVLAIWALFRNSTRAASTFVVLELVSIVAWYVRVIAWVAGIH